MPAGIARRVLPLALLPLAASAGAAPLTLQATYDLASSLSAAPGNYFHPQGLGFDDASNELLFVQQNSNKIVRTDLTGNVLGSVSVGSGGDAPGRYLVSVAATATSYVVSDYWFNSNYYDVFQTPKTGGDLTPVGGEKAALIGTPLDVRGNTLYRTEPSNARGTNDAIYSGLSTIRVSSLAAPDTILRTLSLNTPGGIGDLTVDLADNSLYVLSYANGDVYRYDLSTGAQLDFYDLNLQSANAGLAYGNGSLYYYDWLSTGSKLSVYSVRAVPEPASFAVLGLGTVAFLRRRRRA